MLALQGIFLIRHSDEVATKKASVIMDSLDSIWLYLHGCQVPTTTAVCE